MSAKQLIIVKKILRSALLCFKDIIKTTYDLFKVIIPVIILVKIIEEVGGIKYLSKILEPIMSFVGLPASMGIVWTTSMLVNLSAGMVMFMSSAAQASLSIAQVTVLGCMMLVAHSLPVEVSIAGKSGVRMFYIALLRIGGAIVFGFILHTVYSTSGYLSEANTILLRMPAIAQDTLIDWIKYQAGILFKFFLVISGLLILLRFLKVIGIETLMIKILKPLLRPMRMHTNTTAILIIGITLGITYGGGLIINETKKGHISAFDIFGSITFLSLCHSLIEDTLLMLLLGADISGVLYARIIFTVMVVIPAMFLTRKKLSKKKFTQFFVYPSVAK